MYVGFGLRTVEPRDALTPGNEAPAGALLRPTLRACRAMQCQYAAIWTGCLSSKVRLGAVGHPTRRARVIVAPVPAPVRNRDRGRWVAVSRAGLVERYFLLHHLLTLKISWLRHDFLVQAPLGLCCLACRW
jgi:hypothetical protein